MKNVYAIYDSSINSYIAFDSSTDIQNMFVVDIKKALFFTSVKKAEDHLELLSSASYLYMMMFRDCEIIKCDFMNLIELRRTKEIRRSGEEII